MDRAYSQYTEAGRQQVMMANEPITVGSNSYEIPQLSIMNSGNY